VTRGSQAPVDSGVGGEERERNLLLRRLRLRPRRNAYAGQRIRNAGRPEGVQEATRKNKNPVPRRTKRERRKEKINVALVLARWNKGRQRVVLSFIHG
jgi:hypothetical protein